MTVKALRIFISIYPFMKSECLSVVTKLTLYKALISSIVTCACPESEFAADRYLLKFETAASAKQSFPHQWQFIKAHTDPRFAHGV